jgi:hypothetical protein
MFICLFVCLFCWLLYHVAQQRIPIERDMCLFVLAERFASLCKRGFACSIGRAKSAHLIVLRERERAIQKWSRLAPGRVTDTGCWSVFPASMHVHCTVRYIIVIETPEVERSRHVCVCKFTPKSQVPTPARPPVVSSSRVQTPEQVPSPDMPCNVWASATYAHV